MARKKKRTRPLAGDRPSHDKLLSGRHPRCIRRLSTKPLSTTSSIETTSATTSSVGGLYFVPPKSIEAVAQRRLALWRQRNILSGKQKFLRRVQERTAVVYPVPSVMDAASFVTFVKKRTQRLVARLADPHHCSLSLGVESNSRLHWEAQLGALLRITEKDVEAYVWGAGTDDDADRSNNTAVVAAGAAKRRDRLKSERLLTCLVPYRFAVNIILSRLPKELSSEAVRQLQLDESPTRRESCSVGREDEIVMIRWVEADVFGERDAMRVGSPRTPTFLLLGHTASGKTTLFRALAAAAPARHGGDASTCLLADDATPSEQLVAMTISTRKETCSVAAADRDARSVVEGDGTHNAPHPSYPEAITLIDTPGHRLFSELRLHTLIAVDVALIVVALDEGVQPQTREAIVLALNVDRPVVVVFNKLDAFTDEGSGGNSLRAVTGELRDLGLDVTLVPSAAHLHATLGVVGGVEGAHSDAPWRPFVCRQGEIDPEFKGSVRSPSLGLRRRALGFCVAASRGWNVDLLWDALSWIARCHPPRAVADNTAARTRPCGVQAFVLGATKQAYDADAPVVPSLRGAYEARVASHRRRREKALERRRGAASVKAKIVQSQYYYAYGQGGQSSGQGNPFLFMTVLVKSGVLAVGTPFVADQAVGIVEEMLDHAGRRVTSAAPGTVVTVVDKNSHCGAPGGGIHVLSLPTYHAAYRVFEHRLRLHQFVSTFPDKTHLLRPRSIDSNGLDVAGSLFKHLGIYRGSEQSDVELGNHLAMQLLYGAPPPPPSKQLASGAGGDDSMALFAEAAALAQQGISATPSGRVGVFLQNQAALARQEEDRELEASGDGALDIHRVWLSLQPTAPQSPQSRVVHVGVMLKTDGWHSARILQREVAKLGCTKRVQMQVVVARFGRMTLDDYMAASGVVKVVLCYRTPPADCVQLEKHFPIHNILFGECSTMASALRFLKESAVKLHWEAVARDGDDDDADDGRGNKNNVVVLDDEDNDESPHRQVDDGGGRGKQRTTTRLPNGCDGYLGHILQEGTGISAKINPLQRNKRQRLTTKNR